VEDRVSKPSDEFEMRERPVAESTASIAAGVVALRLTIP
jgi:hypothetical protein